MTQQNALSIYGQFDQIQRAAAALQTSGYFTDVKTLAQAIVKVMAGAELGIPPFASMTGINIIQGKPALGANILATLVKNDPRYDYRVKQATNETCILTWYEDGKPVGEAGFTIQEAQVAGLTGKDNWRKYPSDMLFARAISRGARRFAPGIFGGAPIYTPDELGADVDPDGYIDAKAVEVKVFEPAPNIHEPEPEAVQEPEPGVFEPAPNIHEPEPVHEIVMTLEEAMNTLSSDGKTYGSLSSDKLSLMTIGIANGLKHPDITDEQKAVYDRKMDAIKIILNTRNNISRGQNE